MAGQPWWFRRGLLDHRRMIDETEKLVKELDVRIPPPTPPSATCPAASDRASRSRATHWASKLILLDEPTAALGVAKTAGVLILAMT